jgi:hypothetical protein
MRVISVAAISVVLCGCVSVPSPPPTATESDLAAQADAHANCLYDYVQERMAKLRPREMDDVMLNQIAQSAAAWCGYKYWLPVLNATRTNYEWNQAYNAMLIENMSDQADAYAIATDTRRAYWDALGTVPNGQR